MLRNTARGNGGRIFSMLCAAVSVGALLLGFWVGFSFAPPSFFSAVLEIVSPQTVLAAYVPAADAGEEDLLDPLLSAPFLLANGSAALHAGIKTAEWPQETLRVVAEAEILSGQQTSSALPTDADMSKPIVALYCTHSAETYPPTDGVEKLNGKNGGVYQVAQTLCEHLISLGIPAVVDDTIHDYPDWSSSYSNSLKTMQKLKETYPSLVMFVDVHRDANCGSTVFTYQGGQAAQVMLVVGSDKRSEHPNWEQNLAFAQKIANRMEEKAAGILRGVRVQNGRYNQHFSPHAILLEMGSTENSLAQVKTSAAVVAEALAEIIVEEGLMP